MKSECFFVLSLYFPLFSCFFDRLWNELTIKLHTFVKHPALRDEKLLLELYNQFITSFETK